MSGEPEIEFFEYNDKGRFCVKEVKMRIAYGICAALVLAMIVVGCKRKEPEGAATEEPASAAAADVNEGGVGDVITVLTYNTHLFEGETRTGTQLKNVWDSVTNLRQVSMIEPVEYDDNKRAERIAERIRACGADIVGLQEVWKYERQVWFMDALRDVYPHGFHAGELDRDWRHVVGSLSALGKGWTTCGLVLLSKYPLKDMEFSRFPGTPKGNDYYARKGVLTATVEPWPGGPTFRVAISHAWTDAGGKKLTNITHIANRTLGSGQPGPAIMMGDFNIHYTDPENYGTMERIFKNFGAFDTYAELYPDAANDGFTVDFANNYLHQVFSYTKRQGSRLDYVYVKESGDGLTLRPVEAEVIRKWNYPVEIGWWRVWGGTWMANYVAICSFYLDGHPYLFGLKKPTLFREGNVAWIRRINDDGRGWEKPGFKGKWRWNYVGTAIDTFELNGRPHIFALKKNTIWRTSLHHPDQ
jgi:endonuclease/exonuclease/phosphatase family metal-dependent hydrolase